MQTASKAGELVADRYRLVDRLGAGGMGTVWRADDVLLERKVALKEVVIPSGLPETEVTRLRRRYLREARAAARLHHENVVVVHDVISAEHTVWIVMELLECPDLAAIVSDEGPLTPAEVARVGLHVLEALVAAHAAGVLHRDVKPANVLITGSGRAVLTDFGVASVAGDASLTATGQLIGSPAYFAPERLTGDTAGPASDLWSLGCTLYAAVEGTSPFWRPEPFEILSAITVEALPRPQRAGRLAPVLYGLLEKDPAERWDAERTRAALERVAAGMAVEAAPAWGAPAVGSGETAEVRRPAPGQAPPGAAVARQSAAPAPEPVTGGRAAATRQPVAPAPEPPPAPAPPRKRRRRVRIMLVLLLAAVLAGAVAAVAYPPLRTKVLGAEGSPSPEPGGAGSEPRMWSDPDAHYKVAHLPEWTPDCPTTGFCRFSTGQASDASGSKMTIFIEVKDAHGKNSLALATAYEQKLRGDRKTYPNYRRLNLRWKTPGQYTGAVHEFTFDHPLNGPRHVLVFRTVTGGLSYELSLNGPADQFDAARSVFDDMVRSLVIFK